MNNIKMEKFNTEEKKFVKGLIGLEKIHTDESRKLIELHNKTFGTKVTCTTCASTLMRCIERLVEKLNNETKKK
jgi:hypothetical protein